MKSTTSESEKSFGIYPLKILAAFAFSFCASMSLAEPQTLNDAKLITLNRCLQQGIQQVQRLDLRKLRAKILEIPFVAVQSLEDSSDPARRHAYYQSGVVFYSDKILAQSKGALELLALHEGLGSLGYLDNDYQISILLHSLCNMKSKDEQRELMNSSLLRWHLGATQLAGGTKVGGGGDWEAAVLKLEIMKTIPAGKASVSHSILISELSVEPTSSISSNVEIVASLAKPHKGLTQWLVKAGRPIVLFPRLAIRFSKTGVSEAMKVELADFFKKYFQLIEILELNGYSNLPPDWDELVQLAKCEKMYFFTSLSLKKSNLWTKILEAEIKKNFAGQCWEMLRHQERVKPNERSKSLMD